jgi:hypothetical protein
MSQSKTGTLPLPIPAAAREAVRAEPQSIPARRASVAPESAFLDTRLLVRSLVLGAVLVGSVYLAGRLLPVAVHNAAGGVRTAPLSRAHRVRMPFSPYRTTVSR